MNADLLQTGQNRCGGQPCVAACQKFWSAIRFTAKFFRLRPQAHNALKPWVLRCHCRDRFAKHPWDAIGHNHAIVHACRKLSCRQIAPEDRALPFAKDAAEKPSHTAARKPAPLAGGHSEGRPAKLAAQLLPAPLRIWRR